MIYKDVELQTNIQRTQFADNVIEAKSDCNYRGVLPQHMQEYTSLLLMQHKSLLFRFQLCQNVPVNLLVHDTCNKAPLFEWSCLFPVSFPSFCSHVLPLWYLQNSSSIPLKNAQNLNVMHVLADKTWCTCTY